MSLTLARFALLSILAAVAAWLVVTSTMAPDVPQQIAQNPAPATGTSWFDRMRPHCNEVEVETAMRRLPPDLTTAPGVGYASACLALAGRIDSARALMAGLDPSERVQAAGFVFEVGHPVADMGDDRSAGPMMELVVTFWPNHYMALYHAGASAYQLGHYARAQEHLASFLRIYSADDGWAGAARGMLRRMREEPAAPPHPVEDPHG